MKRLFECCTGFVQVGVLCMSAGARTPPKASGTKALGPQIATLLAPPAVAQAHWGIAVTAMDGTPIYSMNEAQLFQPASNAKLFTTAAAMALLGGGTTFETRVVAKGVLSAAGTLTGDLYLVGDGDANLSGRTIPYAAPAKGAISTPVIADLFRYLDELAEQVVKSGIKRVDGNVIGDDTLFPRELYPEDWAIDDMVWGYGAPISALSINDNQIKVTVTPRANAGAPAFVTFEPQISFYGIQGFVLTTKAGSGADVDFSREPGSKMLNVAGSIAMDSQPDVEEIAISDPAAYAAAAFIPILESKGIVVSGKTGERNLGMAVHVHGFEAETREPIADLSYGNFSGDRLRAQFCFVPVECLRSDERVVASHRSPTLAEDVMVTNKVSQNLHAELLLRQLAVAYGINGSIAQGARVVRAFLTTRAGVDPDDFVFFDGSGLSGHDLVTPRATARLLQYASTQPWFADWRRSLPVGGEDGSLMERFAKAPLAGHVFAKTGTLGEARALSGYLDCASGKTVIFSIMVGNHAPGSNADRDVMDKVVAAIAATN